MMLAARHPVLPLSLHPRPALPELTVQCGHLCCEQPGRARVLQHKTSRSCGPLLCQQPLLFSVTQAQRQSLARWLCESSLL